MRPFFQHRHFVKIADIIRKVFAAPERRHIIAEQFAKELSHTNQHFSPQRFVSAAMGEPVNGRDRLHNARHAPPDVGAIMAYENGELDADGERRLFQSLVDSGLAWKLQGHYGRTAAAMIKAGEIDAPTVT